MKLDPMKPAPPVTRYRIVSDPDVVRCGHAPTGITGVGGSYRLNEHDLALSDRPRPVLLAPRNDEHLARGKRHATVAEIDGHLAFDHNERLIRIGVAVPYKI